MKLLSLLRHATAASHASDDHSRPLSDIGQGEAVDIAEALAASPLPPPDMILSSDSARTHATAITLKLLFPAATLHLDPTLYLASHDALLAAAQLMDDTHRHVMLVAHNPGIGQLAFDLGGGSHPAVACGFAPATLATFECGIATWAELRPAHAKLISLLSA